MILPLWMYYPIAEKVFGGDALAVTSGKHEYKAEIVVVVVLNAPKQSVDCLRKKVLLRKIVSSRYILKLLKSGIHLKITTTI